MVTRHIPFVCGGWPSLLSPKAVYTSPFQRGHLLVYLVQDRTTTRCYNRRPDRPIPCRPAQHGHPACLTTPLRLRYTGAGGPHYP